VNPLDVVLQRRLLALLLHRHQQLVDRHALDQFGRPGLQVPRAARAQARVPGVHEVHLGLELLRLRRLRLRQDLLEPVLQGLRLLPLRQDDLLHPGQELRVVLRRVERQLHVLVFRRCLLLGGGGRGLLLRRGLVDAVPRPLLRHLGPDVPLQPVRRRHRHRLRRQAQVPAHVQDELVVLVRLLLRGLLLARRGRHRVARGIARLLADVHQVAGVHELGGPLLLRGNRDGASVRLDADLLLDDRGLRRGRGGVLGDLFGLLGLARHVTTPLLQS